MHLECTIHGEIEKIITQMCIFWLKSGILIEKGCVVSPNFSTVKLLFTALQSVFCGERYFELCKYPFTLKKTFNLYIYFFVFVRTWDFLFYSMNYTLLSFTLMLKFFLIWPVGAHSCWLQFLLDMSPSFFEHFLSGNKIF